MDDVDLVDEVYVEGVVGLFVVVVGFVSHSVDGNLSKQSFVFVLVVDVVRGLHLEDVEEGVGFVDGRSQMFEEGLVLKLDRHELVVVVHECFPIVFHHHRGGCRR